MKKLTSLFLLFLFAHLSLLSQTGWMWQKPDPQGNELKAVSTKGTNWAVGAHGTVIHKVLPGDYWELVDIGTTENLNDIDIYSITKKGWIVGDNGTIYYTEDNGETWIAQTSGVTVDLHSVSAVNDACVWVCGEKGTVLKSYYDDGGTWENVSPPQILNLYGIDSYHCNEAWAVGEDGFIISTENGGQTWTSHLSGTSWDLYALDMHDNSTSYACGRSGIIISKDWDEDTWTNENESLNYWLNSIVSSTGAPDYAVGSEGMILRGTDGVWTQKETGFTWELNDISSIALQDYTYQVVGRYGIIMKNDGFDTDFEIENDFFWDWFLAIDFVNADTGWAVGGDPGWGGTYDGIIVYTVDGGETWEVQKHLQTLLSDIKFVNESQGWAVGKNGLILHTATGGQVWTTQQNPLSGKFTSVSFTDENNGWVVSSSNWGEIIHTSNGGNDWVVQTNPSDKPLHDVFFLDENNGWAVGLEAAVIRTSDGGETWVQIDVNASQGFRFASVYFVDNMHGWIAGIDGSILRTTDGGNTWEEVETGTFEIFNDIFFIDTENGWAVGDQGMIMHSTDGGATWYRQASGVATNFITSVYFIDDQKGWVCGEGGTIKYTIHGGSNQVNVIYVDDDNNSGTEDGSLEYPYNTVMKAIDAALPGDSIYIFTGEYLETPLTELPIEDGVIIAGEDSSGVIIAIPFYTGELTMKYFTKISGLTCPGYSFANGDGNATIKIERCHFDELTFSSGSGYKLFVEDCTIDGYITNTSGSNYLTVRNNRFTDGGIYDSGGAPEGVEAHIVEGNEFNWSGTDRQDEAVIFTNSTSITVKNNTINVNGPGSGMILNSGTPTNVTGNTIILNNGSPVEGMTGIDTKAGKGVVTGNTISGGWTGYVSSSAATLFENNTITKTHTGFVSKGAEKVQNNTIKNCTGNGLIAKGLTGPVQNNTIIDNDSAGIVTYYPVDLGGGDKNGEGRNTLQNNGYYDLHIKYQPEEQDTLFAKYNLWDHTTEEEILANDILNEGGGNLFIQIEDFLVLPDTPELTSPADNSSDVNPNTILTWSETAVSDYYHLQLAEDDSFSDPVVDTGDLAEPQFAVTLQPQTTYYWHVKATNPAGESNWSETWQFTTGVSGIGEHEMIDFEIYPNPADKEFGVRSLEFGVGDATIELYDLNGRKILEKQIPKESKEITVDVRRLKSGLYFCRITTEKGSVTKKVVVE